MGTSSNILSPYINGRFLQLNRPERIFHTQNPVNPGDVLAVTGWNKDLVGEIVEAAKRAQFQFAAQSLSSRMQFVNAVIANLRQSSEEMNSAVLVGLWSVSGNCARSSFVIYHGIAPTNFRPRNLSLGGAGRLLRWVSFW